MEYQRMRYRMAGEFDIQCFKLINILTTCIIEKNFIILTFTQIYQQVKIRHKRSFAIKQKTAPEGAAFDYLINSYAVFRLANPIKPIKPEPKSQTAAGTGTAFIDASLTRYEPRSRRAIVGDANEAPAPKLGPT